jgi:hypothetical protein
MTDAPERIYHWLDSQLSIARHYGGCWYNDHEYRGEAMCAALLASVPHAELRGRPLADGPA